MVRHSNHRKGPPRGGQVAAAPEAPATVSAAVPPTLSGLGEERVAKALARAGVASRREIERLIGAGRVALNGQVLTTPAVKVGANDILTVDGAPVESAEPARLFLYHKPPGLVTTHSDPKGRPTVFQALPRDLPRLISVGRLDLASEGLLLLTNDGGLSRALELPATGLARQYRARARGRIDQERLDALQAGITVEGVRYGAITAHLDKAKDGPSGANLWITLTLAEGKNREVRRVLEALGLSVNRLIRIAYGPFALGDLERGAVREVGPRVLREQLGHLIAPAHLPKGERPQYQPPAPAKAAAPKPRGTAIARAYSPKADGKKSFGAKRPGPKASKPGPRDATTKTGLSARSSSSRPRRGRETGPR
jgi:23S rRNA pseudouridine2605 synthase